MAADRSRAASFVTSHGSTTSGTYQRLAISGPAVRSGDQVDVRVSQDASVAGDVFLVDAITLIPRGL